VAALLISLKVHLLRGSLRGSLSQRIGLAVGALTGLGAALAGVAALIGLRFADPDVAAVVVVVGGAALVLGWGLVPLLVSGVDETLDPARFALLPLRARQMVPGLVLAGLVGVPGAVTALVALATVITWWRGVLPALLALPAAVLGVLTCVVTSRLLTTAAARLLSTRRFKEIGAAITVLLMSSLGLWPTLIAHGTLTLSDLEAGVAGLGWTPMGLAWAVPADAATGQPGRALVRLALAAVVVLAGAAAWAHLLDRALADQSGSAPSSRARVRRSLLDRLPDGVAWAVMQRSLHYWRRDPRYLVAFTAITASTIVPLLALRSAGTPAPAAGLGPFVGVLLGIVTSNDIGYDGSAFATHLVVGVRGQADRLGRAMAALVVGLPVVVVASVAGVLVAGHGRLWPAALGAGVGALLAGVGGSALASALVPYPVPEAGSNPFRGTSGGGARAALAQGAVLSATSALSAPAIACLVVAAVWWPPAAWIALPLGPAIGAAALWVGVAAGGRVMDGRGPEILASVRRPT
jgi:ABC-2 type transport system permease protein